MKEHAQRQTDQWLRLILQYSIDGINICTFDPVTLRRKLVLCNDSYVASSGYSREQLMACENLEQLVVNHYERPGQDMEVYRCLLEGKSCQGRASWKRPDGLPSEYEWTAVPIRMGETIYIFGIDRDVTKQRLTEQSQKQTDQWLRLILQHSTDGINVCQYDPATRGRRLVMCNDRYVEMTGRSLQELLSAEDVNPFVTPLTPEPQRGVRHEKIMKGGVAYSGRSSWNRPDGRENYVEWSAASFHIDGKIYTVGVDRDVTEQELARRALRESEHRYRTLVEMSPDAICMLDMQGRMLMSNEAGLRVYGYDSVEEVNATVPSSFDFVVPQERGRLMESMSELMVKGTARAPFTVLRKDGSTFPAELSGSLLVDEEGKPSCMMIITRDLTEHNRQQRALEESERRYRALVQTSPDAIYLLDMQGKLVTCSDTALKTFGYDSLEEVHRLVPDAFDAIVPEQQRQATRESMADLIRLGTLRNVYLTMARRDGTTFPAEINASLLRDAEGNPAGIIIVNRDISERQLQQEALAKSEYRYRTLMETAGDAILVAEFETGRIVDCNEKACTLLRMPRERILQLSQPDICPPELRETYRRDYESSIARGGLSDEAQVLRGDGSRVWVTISSSTYEIDGTKFVQGIFHDMSGRLQAEQELRQSQERYRAIVENQFECVCRWQPDTTLTFVNEQYCRTFGKTRQELIGSKWIELIPQEIRETVLERYRRLTLEPRVLTYDHEVMAAGGQRRWEQWTDCPIQDEQGNVIEFQSVGRDITEVRHKEEQLRQVQKMEAVGLLAGGIAHDFNNQLTVIKGYCDLLLRSPAASEGVATELEEIRRAAKRAADLTSQLLTFSRQQVLRPQVVNLNHVLTGLKGPLATMVGEAVSLILDLDKDLGNVRADILQLEQAVMNLALNARDAMPRGGSLMLRTSQVDAGEMPKSSRPAAQGPHVLLEITDTGVGMDSATLGHIFDPFFTTKPVGQGTGLGLSMVYGFVQQSGGHIEVDSQKGEGSTFRIYLPRIDAPASAVDQAAPSGAPRGRETVLIAEDSLPVRQLLVRVLGECGYSVLEAPNAEEAMLLADRHADKLTMLVTDVVMPKMSGPELARLLRQRYEGLRVLFITGYARDTIIPHGFEPHENVLAKPFTAERLAQVVRQVLDGRT